MKVDAGQIRIIMRPSRPEIEAVTPSTVSRSPTSRSPRSPASVAKSGLDSEHKASNIHVYVRVRPLAKDEIASGVKSAVEVSRDETTIQVVDRQQSFGYTAMKTFQFDGCFGPSITQEKLMEKCNMRKLLDSVLDGYSSTVMAYGQTGSGKTYTMCGRQEGSVKEKITEGGVIARSVRYIFEAIRRRTVLDDQKTYSLRASYFEIYNEQVHDLLREECSPREVRWNQSDGFHVEGLLVVDCETVEDVFAVVNEGAKNRKVGSHNQNKDSSRSHCIMTLYVDSISSMGDGPILLRHGRLLFVDLAGSERLKKTKSSGDMLKETGSINRSLFTLGKVISALSEGKKEEIVPYRESMLTKLIMESLGGSSLGLMIACVSPATTVVDQTLSTLHYATCAKQIVNIPSVKMDEKDRVITQLQKEVSRLKDENQSLRSKLGIMGTGQICDIATLSNCASKMCMPCSKPDARPNDYIPSKEITGGEKLPEGRLSRNGSPDKQPGSEDWSVVEFFTRYSRESLKGTGKAKWLQQAANRRQRICVDHLTPSIKNKVLSRTSSRCGPSEPDFQGSIIVNHDAFYRMLDLDL
ncbi:kinesin-like protein KIF3A [Selaginella moellendorffii]|uniref:kinesin-like protein KIF3A n=1 Tax=Selaginella moellendorffii TaxID=88036 RepID=UPI000D1C8339|nr:kinesin-like protein KIF3A [Selaginella moellendorffii]|eukprot:XP_024537495.1 kinesin-like protein KIF3A [Selaginella moellendorffii]